MRKVSQKLPRIQLREMSGRQKDEEKDAMMTRDTISITVMDDYVDSPNFKEETFHIEIRSKFIQKKFERSRDNCWCRSLCGWGR